MTFSFLLCSERSGSNLTTRLLDAHPEICGPSPVHLFRVLTPNLFRYGDLARDHAWAALVDDAARLLAAMTGVWRRRLSAEEICAATPERSLASIVSAVYHAEAASHGKIRVFVKENHVHEFFDVLESAFPEARYLWVVRDPRDMALSWKRAAALRGGVVRAAKAWRDDQRGFARLARRLGEGERVVTVRYETLLSEPETSLRRMCAHLGVSYSEALTTFHEDPLTRRNAERISGWSNLGRALMRGNSGKFRRGLSATETRYVEALCAREMAVFGYLPETGGGDLERLERELLPREPWEKAAYRELPAEERRAHARWRRATAQIDTRRLDEHPGP